MSASYLIFGTNILTAELYLKILEKVELAVLCMPESKKLLSMPERHKRSKKQRAHFRTKNLTFAQTHVTLFHLHKIF